MEKPPAGRPVFWLTLALLGLAQLAVGWFLPPAGPDPRATPPLIARGGVAVCPVQAGFGDDGVYDATRADTAPPGVERFGSWLPGIGDAGTGRLETPWFDPGVFFEVLVAGYPAKPGNAVLLQLRRAATDGTAEVPERELPLHLPDAHEQWVQHRVIVPPVESGGPWRARLVAVDNSREPGGWLGVSAPFREGRHGFLWSLGTLGRLMLTLAAAVAALLGPGVALRAWGPAKNGARNALSLALLPLPGAAWLVAVALVCWRLAPGVDPRHVAAAGLLPVFGICAAVFGRRVPAGRLFGPVEARVLALAGLLLLTAVGKAQLSVGPAGELYGGTVSRTLEVGTRSDPRIAFHVVQLVAHGLSPFGAEGRAFFTGWGFTSRGPLPGLASAPLVLVTGAQPPATMPDQPWEPFDREGFAAYRVAMMVLGAAALLGVYAAGAAAWRAGTPGSPGRGLLAVALTVLAPFVVHEVYFPWGKLPAAGALLAAAAGLAAGRPGLAGGLAAVAYGCHPLALLYVPFLAVGAAWTAGNGVRRRVIAAVSFALPLAAAVVGWRLLGRADRANGAGQDLFLNYLFMPGGREHFAWGPWAHHRLDSVLNTLVPGWLYFFGSAHPEVNAVDAAPSAAVVHWFLQCWNTLPLGVGLLGFPWLLGRWARVARAAPGVFAWVVAAPFALFAVCWGAAPTGLLREGLHPWVLTLGVLAAFGTAGPGRTASWPLAPGRGLEVLAMTLLPVALTSPQLPRPAFAWVDGAALALHLTAVGALSVLCFRVYRASDPFPGDPRDHEELLAHGPPQPGQAQEEPHQD